MHGLKSGSDAPLGLILACLLLAGCQVTPPDGTAIKAAVEACERASGVFYYFDGGSSVTMKCTIVVK